MKIHVIALTFVILIILSEIQWISGLLDPVTLTVGGIGAGLLGAGYQKYLKCKIFECCNDDNVPINVTELQQKLATKLYGQQIAQTIVIRALRGYKATKSPGKALAMSFHGPTGTGKNYVSSMISATFFKRGTMSHFYHLFSGSTFSKKRLEEHKELVKNTIVETLLQCERSIFVFDEVHEMPEGLLEVLLPFLDYAQPAFIEYKSQRIRINSNKAIFIFLTNVSGSKIVDQALKYRLEGKKREDLRIQDFENLISGSAWEERGGFLNSNTVKSSLIDYYVPFLPLEKEHVELCIDDAFKSDDYPNPPTQAMKEDVFSTVIYGPPPHNIFATSGCKRLETKVNSARQMDYEVM